jgi:hypothetical protein
MKSAAPNPTGTATASAISPTRMVPHNSDAMPKVPEVETLAVEGRPRADQQEDADQSHDHERRDRGRARGGDERLVLRGRAVGEGTAYARWTCLGDGAHPKRPFT